MKNLIRNSTYAAAIVTSLVGLTMGCGQKNTQNAPAPPTVASTTANTPVATASDVPVVVNGPEMTQSVPPPPQVAANPNAVEIVHKLPPIPAHVTSRHKHLHLVKYENKYWLQDVDHHCYIAARDNSGHFYPACYDTSGSGTVYPLYYDSQRDDYYRACSDHDNHYFRCYEDEPDYVYYYDNDPIYRSDRSGNGNGWNSEYEPEIDAPAYSADWGSSIPVFSAALFVLPRWHSNWWTEKDWSSGGDSFVNISIGRPYFNYYSVPSDYPFVYANTLYTSNSGWRTNPGWYKHDNFNQTAYQSGSYRSFSGYGQPAAAGTIAASYEGSHAFHEGSNPHRIPASQMAVVSPRSGSGSFGKGSGPAIVHNGAAGNTFPAGRPSSTMSAATAHPVSGSFVRGGGAAAIHGQPGGAIHSGSGSFGRGGAVTVVHNGLASHSSAARINNASSTLERNQGSTIAHARTITKPSNVPIRPAQSTHTQTDISQMRRQPAPAAPNRPSFRSPAESNRPAVVPSVPAHRQQVPGALSRPGFRSPAESNRPAAMPLTPAHRQQVPVVPTRPSFRNPASSNRPVVVPSAQSRRQSAPAVPTRPSFRIPSASNRPSVVPSAPARRQSVPTVPARPAGRTAPSPNHSAIPSHAKPGSHPSNEKGKGADGDRHKP